MTLAFTLFSFFFRSAISYASQWKEVNVGRLPIAAIHNFSGRTVFVSRDSLEVKDGRGNEESGKVQEFTTRHFLENGNLDKVVLLLCF